MSERKVSVKRLIDNSMYEKLMEDSKKYQELLKKNHEQKDNSDETLKDNSDSTLKDHNDALNKSGAGVCSVIPVPPKNLNPENTDQRDEQIIPKCTEVDSEETKVNVTYENESENNPLSDEAIIQDIRIRFRPRAKKLLMKFKNFPTKILWNSQRIVKLNDVEYNDTNIKELLGLCFYNLKSRKIGCLSIFIELLKELNLIIYVRNFEIRRTNMPLGWYYIGNAV